jgi:hypothetical protein
MSPNTDNARLEIGNSLVLVRADIHPPDGHTAIPKETHFSRVSGI